MKKSYTLISPCFFGMEKMLAREIKDLGFEIIKTEDGRVTYKTDEHGIAKANMWLRCAERVHLKVAEFEAKTFDELFEGTKRINWAKYIPYGAQFPITKASSIKSKLHSTPHIQSIVKKAIVESLKKSYLEDGLLKEDKEKYPIYVFIHKDKVILSIDTTGDALHKRGYREKANKAPIRETLAAAIMYLTPWKPGRTLVDPMCGSGTMLIEAAMMGINMAPGLNREFISEKWRTLDKKIWWDTRKDAFDKIDNDIEFKNKTIDLCTRDEINNYLRLIASTENSNIYLLCTPMTIQNVYHIDGDISMINPTGGPIICIGEAIDGTKTNQNPIGLIPSKIEFHEESDKFLIYIDN